jgi:protease I
MVRVLMIVAPENYRDEELDIPKKHLESKGMEVTVASTKKGPCKGMMGGSVEATLSLADVNVSDYDAVIFVGGSGTPIIRKEARAIEIAKEAASKGKVIGAICWACTTVAKAGILEGKKATVWVGDDAEYGMSTDKVMEKFGATYEKSGVVVDGNFVTADGPAHARQFAEAIEKLIG